MSLHKFITRTLHESSERSKIKQISLSSSCNHRNHLWNVGIFSRSCAMSLGNTIHTHIMYCYQFRAGFQIFQIWPHISICRIISNHSISIWNLKWTKLKLTSFSQTCYYTEEKATLFLSSVTSQFPSLHISSIHFSKTS